jgi:hypothetical protein
METPNSDAHLDAKKLHAEDRQRMRKMMQSPEFRLFLDRCILPHLYNAHLVLRRPHSSREDDLLAKGSSQTLHLVLKWACDIAQIPALDVLSPQQEIGLDLSRLQQTIETQTPPTAPGTGSYGSQRSSVPA